MNGNAYLKPFVSHWPLLFREKLKLVLIFLSLVHFGRNGAPGVDAESLAERLVK